MQENLSHPLKRYLEKSTQNPNSLNLEVDVEAREMLDRFEKGQAH